MWFLLENSITLIGLNNSSIFSQLKIEASWKLILPQAVIPKLPLSQRAEYHVFLNVKPRRTFIDPRANFLGIKPEYSENLCIDTYLR